jgi:hypothetical protein
MTRSHVLGFAAGDLVRPSLPMFTLGDALSDEEVTRIQSWTDRWLNTALELRFVDRPFVVDDSMVADIHACYRMKMDPEEAVYFCFRLRDESQLF